MPTIAMNKRTKNRTCAYPCLWAMEQCCCYCPPECSCCRDSYPSSVSIEQIVTWVALCSLIYLLFNTIKLMIVTLFVLSLLYWTCKRLPISRWINEFFGIRQPPEAPGRSIDSLAEAGQEPRDPDTNVSDEQDNDSKRAAQDTTVGCKGIGSDNEYVALFRRQTH